MDEQMDCMDRWIDWMDWMDRWMAWMAGWMDSWHSWIDKWIDQMSVLDAMYEWMECMNIHISLNVSTDANSNTDTLVGWLLRQMAGRH